MFEKLTGASRRTLTLSRDEARRLNHDHLGTEHLLLGLVAAGAGIAVPALEPLGVDLASTRREVTRIFVRGRQASRGHIPFSTRANRSLEASWDEAVRLGHDRIATGHLLLALIREGEGGAARALGSLGAGLGELGETVTGLLAALGPEEPPGPGPVTGRRGWPWRARRKRPRRRRNG